MQYRSAGQRRPWTQTWRHGYDLSWYSSTRRTLSRANWWLVVVGAALTALTWVSGALLDLILPLLA